MRAVAFLRVSTPDQKLGLEAQRDAIEAYARAHDLDVVAWHTEIVSGGARLEVRHGLEAALADLVALEASVFVAAKWDRITRSPTVGIMVEELARRAGATVVAADGAGNGSDPAAELFRGMLLLFGQFERRMIGARTKAALAAKRARGEKLGGPAPGGEFRRDVNGRRHYIPAAQLERAREAACEGGPPPTAYDWKAVTRQRRARRASA